MTNTAAVLEQPEVEVLGLPNKCTYPVFAGFSGEKYLKDILRLILPRALFNTWEILFAEQAYDNDMYLSLPKLATKAGRALRTIRNHLAEFRGKRLMIERIEPKVFFNQDGSTRIKKVVVKDFAGLYDLAYEYHLWSTEDPNYVEPDPELVEDMRQDQRLVAKLRRFDNYRRLLYNEAPGPVCEPKAYPWFTDPYGESSPVRAEDASSENSDSTRPIYLSKDLSKQLSKVTQERINEKAYTNDLNGDSFDSDEDHEGRGEASATSTVVYKSVAQDYTKEVREYETGTQTPNESQTNPSPQENVPPGVGKTRESTEIHPDVQQARQAMAVAGFAPGRSAHRQAGTELPLPSKHPLARSFVHEIAGLFGDLNEKGSKTGIERSIETFGLEQPADVLLCLVRAYVIARDTKAEKIRYHHPQTSAPNRMPLFCTMFTKFARSLGPGSRWEYTWERMMEDVAADDRLSLWVSEHQAELVDKKSDQAATTEVSAPAQPESAGDTVEVLVERTDASEKREKPEATPSAKMISTDDPQAGWPTFESADNRGEHLLDELDPFRQTYTWVVRSTPYGRWGFEIVRRQGRIVVASCLSKVDIAKERTKAPRAGSVYMP